VEKTGYNAVATPEVETFYGQLVSLRERYRVHTSATLAVLTALTFISAEIVPAVQKFVLTSGLLQFVTLIALLDLAVAIYRQQRPPAVRLATNQDESMPKLIEATPRCRTDGADLLEYAGATTLPLIRAIRREGVPMRMLVKHPETVAGLQKQRMITTLDTLYNSIFDRYEGLFEIRCYRLPFTIRGRRLGKEILELGWLTSDTKRQTAYGHANPSIIADLSTKSTEHLRAFFDKTFDDLWKDEDTEDGRAVLQQLQGNV